MRYAGIDIGSRSIEFVIIENDKIVKKKMSDTGFDPLTQAKKIIENSKYDTIIATGYGRTLLEISFDIPTVTEIKAHAKGAFKLFHDAFFILDIGGQDSKVIRLNDQGRVIKFEMNDRCAAGTGKFLEIMAKSLGFTINEFGLQALTAEKEIPINSMCTVFAESEVTSLIAKGKKREEIAMGLHKSVAKRAGSMLKKIKISDKCVFTGGVANNPCIVKLLKEITNTEILVPKSPQMVGAYGAALLSMEKTR